MSGTRISRVSAMALPRAAQSRGTPLSPRMRATASTGSSHHLSRTVPIHCGTAAGAGFRRDALHHAPRQGTDMTDLHEFSATTLDGAERSLADYRGQLVLIVNVASRCGFTPQYAGLEALYREFRERGFVVLGFPCDQFGHQEPGDADEIRTFCSTNYDVTFPMFAKIEVNGA